ncbi:uncharacterized protein [Amphiura filiformis]|uniref:uncharacterized protein n=1 Tax=Amphiura filiformis TaxID=82378 RepID=UPI003B213CF7
MKTTPVWILLIAIAYVVQANPIQDEIVRDLVRLFKVEEVERLLEDIEANAAQRKRAGTNYAASKGWSDEYVEYLRSNFKIDVNRDISEFTSRNCYGTYCMVQMMEDCVSVNPTDDFGETSEDAFAYYETDTPLDVVRDNYIDSGVCEAEVGYLHCMINRDECPGDATGPFFTPATHKELWYNLCLMMCH